jgi:16S rRNA (cytosine1402-N4)-methyltransferase
VSDTIHIPVLFNEVIEWLAPKPGAIIVDGTLGGAGHTRELAARVEPGGWVVAMDRDPAAIARAETTLKGTAVKLAHANYRELPEVLESAGIEKVDGILLDLGLSSDQLANRELGFSFDSDGELDMRFDTTAGEPAWRMIERTREEDLANLIYEYGEERLSRRIARRIVEARKATQIRTAAEFANIVRAAFPRTGKPARIDPATRTFQALRIAVNDELGALDQALRDFPDFLNKGGRIAIISFHSLEDRRVKEAFRGDLRLNNLTKKPVTASERELEENPRSRSAKLRVAERV